MLNTEHKQENVTDCRAISCFENYTICSDGKIYGPRGLMKPSVTGKGYLKVWLYKDGKYYPKKVHRLVYENFVGAAPYINDGTYYVIDHINGDKTDNRLENLQYITHKENIQRYWEAQKGA